MKLCENFFIELALTNPKELTEYCYGSKVNKISCGLRARAIESCGKIENHETATEILLKTLYDKEPIIREATIYALEKHLNLSVVKKLRKIVEDDLIKNSIKEACKDAIEIWEQENE